MSKSLDLETLERAVAGDGVAFRCVVTLQPAAGEGTKVFPPTYAGSVYATEQRRLPGCEAPVECVLLDSVQSQANRMEEALLQAIDAERLTIPLVEVDFTPYYPGTKEPQGKQLLDPVGKVSSLEVPHRIADAILRDSLHGEVPFRESDVGKRIGEASAKNATALYQYCPTALVFGMWDSTGPKGGLGVKFERALVAEIVGIDAVSGVRTSSRIDPLGIRRDAGPLFVRKDGNGWTLDESLAKKEKGKSIMLGKDGKPSEANHGNVTPDLKDKSKQPYPGGVTISRAEQSIVLSLPALRRLRFPVEGKHDKARDDAARTVLAALGLCAATLAAENGLDLRSRCLLWPTEPLSWELLCGPGERQEGLKLNAKEAIALLKAALQKASKHDLPWQEKPIELTPSDRLVEIVVKSQQLTAQKSGEADEGGE